MTGLLFVFLVGTMGYWIFRKFHLPVPGILGSLFFAGALNLAGFFPEFPLQRISWYSNIVIGAYVGLQVNRTSIGFLRELPLPAMIISAGMLLISLIGGAALYCMSDLSIATAFLGSTAGGIAEMALLSISLGADVASVTLLQVFRLLSAIILTPIVCRKWLAWTEKKARRKFPGPLPLEQSSQIDDDVPVVHVSNVPSPMGYVFLAMAATAGGLTGFFLHLPVGLLTGAMFAVAATNLAGVELSPVPPALRTIAQIGIGIIIASNITMGTLSQFSSLALPVVLLTSVMLLCSFLFGLLLHQMTGWDYPTCLLSSSLGGLSQMSIISEEMGADPLKVSILQAIRLVSILTVLPFLFSFFFK